MKQKWEEINPNFILRDKDETFYISYNPGNYILPVFGADNGSDETALCADDKFMVLNGDFREDYEKIIDKGLAKCKEFYEKKKAEYGSSWSTG